MSLGSYTESLAISDALDYAYKKGVVVVAASGNSGYDNMISFPASHPTVIAVGAVGSKNSLAPYSNSNGDVDLAAPGGDMTVDADGDGYEDGILQETHLGGEYGYAFFQGTSMASPHVAGAAALLIANGAKSPDQVRAALTSTAKKISGQRYGSLDILSALEYKGDGRAASKDGKTKSGDESARGKGGKSGGSSSSKSSGGKKGKSGKSGKRRR